MVRAKVFPRIGAIHPEGRGYCGHTTSKRHWLSTISARICLCSASPAAFPAEARSASHISSPTPVRPRMGGRGMTSAATPSNWSGLAKPRPIRHTRRMPCQVCGGGENDRRQRGVRCYGFTSEDGRFEFCTREEYRGVLQPGRNGETYRHRLDTQCPCGLPPSASGQQWRARRRERTSLTPDVHA